MSNSIDMGNESAGKTTPQPDAAKSKTPSAKRSRKSMVSASPRKSTAVGVSNSVKRDTLKSPAAAQSASKGVSPKPPEDEPIPANIPDELPENAVPLFLSGKTQEIFSCVPYDDVTEQNPYKLLKKADIIQDLYNRAAISDFHPMKEVVNKYEGDEILIVYDADFKFGQNFFIATTEEAKTVLLTVPGRGGGEGGEDSSEQRDDEEEDNTVYSYVPPVAKVWQSMGSESAVRDETVTTNRKLIKTIFSKPRNAFGLPVHLANRIIDKNNPPIIAECLQVEDDNPFVTKIELHKSTQAVPIPVINSTQTTWMYPRNANTQTTPREFSEEERNKLAQSTELADFMKRVRPRFELMLQQNEIADVFYNDWINLGVDDSSFGTKADHHLKEYQSFTDLQFSQDKTVTAVDWHPTIKGVIAVAVAEKMTAYERIDKAADIIHRLSVILIWSFSDPIHPQLLLEAPEDIVCFKFNPTNPNIIAGGCINGQLVLWDITQHAEKLKVSRGVSKPKNRVMMACFNDDKSNATTMVRYCAVSSIDHGHKSSITCLEWLPDHMEITRLGIPQENRSGDNVQLITCATDSSVLFWDTRPPKNTTSTAQAPTAKTSSSSVATTYKYLDLTWKPHLRVTVQKAEAGGTHSPTCFSIQEIQGKREILSRLSEDKKDLGQPIQTGFSGHKPSSGVKRTLKDAQTNFFVGTEDGELVYMDWMPQKDQDNGKLQTPKPHWSQLYHHGQIVELQRSPFFKHILLVIGGWNFSMWNENISSGPILSSRASNHRLICAQWSPTRPAVFYIGRSDGEVEVWDVLDRTHEPSMTQSISQASITDIKPKIMNSKQHLLAIGDSLGTLHILEIPWSLRQEATNELQGVQLYFEREEKRRAFVVERWQMREREKIEHEAEASRKAGIAPNAILSEEEIKVREKLEYNQYIDDENHFLRELGIKEEEPLIMAA